MANDRILFNAEMVRAILTGRKTQTRRVVKLPSWSTGNWDDFEIDEFGTPLVICTETGCWAEVKAPYGIDRPLLVCETWAIIDTTAAFSGNHFTLAYRANNKQVTLAVPEDAWDKYGGANFDSKWRPSIFMPRWASRITLGKVNVRVERLHDISDVDIFAESIEDIGDGVGKFNHKRGMAQALFAGLWDSINAKRGYAWAQNPLVWVYTFGLDRVKK